MASTGRYYSRSRKTRPPSFETPFFADIFGRYLYTYRHLSYSVYFRVFSFCQPAGVSEKQKSERLQAGFTAFRGTRCVNTRMKEWQVSFHPLPSAEGRSLEIVRPHQLNMLINTSQFVPTCLAGNGKHQKCTQRKFVQFCSQSRKKYAPREKLRFFIDDDKHIGS